MTRRGSEAASQTDSQSVSEQANGSPMLAVAVVSPPPRRVVLCVVFGDQVETG